MIGQGAVERRPVSRRDPLHELRGEREWTRRQVQPAVPCVHVPHTTHARRAAGAHSGASLGGKTAGGIPGYRRVGARRTASHDMAQHGMDTTPLGELHFSSAQPTDQRATRVDSEPTKPRPRETGSSRGASPLHPQARARPRTTLKRPGPRPLARLSGSPPRRRAPRSGSCGVSPGGRGSTPGGDLPRPAKENHG